MVDEDDDGDQPSGKKLASEDKMADEYCENDRHVTLDTGGDDGKQQITRLTSSDAKVSLEDQCLCNSFQCQQVVLSRELDAILNPKVFFQSPNQLDKIWPLIINKPLTEVPSFLKLLADYKSERQCSVTWGPGSIAYRCRTCYKTLVMAICADCFRNGNHEGHDYNMYKSPIGGVCDCGNSIMKESGYCKRHGDNATAKLAHEQIPNSLLCSPKRAMPRLIHRLLIQFRRSHVDLTGETDIYLDFLIQMANSNAVMRDLMSEVLISEQAYSSQIQQLRDHPDDEATRIFEEGLKKLKSEQIGLKPFKLPWGSGSTCIKAFCDNLPITCFIQELIFWTVVFEFPQKLVSFLLSLLVEDKCKQVFARTYVSYYPRIVMILAGVEIILRRHSRDTYEQLARRIMQISVRILNDVDLAKSLCEEESTLHVLIYCLRVAIEGSWSDDLSGVLKINPLCLNDNSAPRVVFCDNPLIRDRHLASFVQDLDTILSLENEALRLVKDRDLLNTWLEMLTYFQTMSPYKRELGEHTPYETSPHVSVFLNESGFCLGPLWSILSHMKVQYQGYTQSLLEAIHLNLSVWFHHMRIGPNSLLDPYYMSFHIPLHRMFAATLRHMIFEQFVPDETIYNFLADNQLIFGTKYSYKSASGSTIAITINDFFKMILLHPLQALTLYHEIRSGMWTRNGLMTNNQAITYVHCVYCYSTIDLDMFLLKYCASKLNPNYFIKILMSRLHGWKWLGFKSNLMMDSASQEIRRYYHFNIRPEQIIQMAESSLVTLLQLLTLSIHCNVSDREQTKEEIVAAISVMDRSYSSLVGMLPNRRAVESSNLNDYLKSLLDELTIYKPAQHGNGGNLQQGCYLLKPSIWDEEYNPLHVQYRFYQKRDYQMSLERFFQHSKLTGKLEKRHHPSALWPPLKVPKNIGNFGQIDLSPIIECQALLGIVFSIIYKNLFIIDVPDTIMAYTIHLLELSLRKCLEKNQQTRSTSRSKSDLTRKQNTAFVGRYFYQELASCPAYDSVGGNKLYALIGNSKKETTEQASSNLFPVVRHALDLYFETTWFPFQSIVDNCLVHIETVHSLPWKEFEIMIKTVVDHMEVPNQDPQSSGVNLSTAYDTMSWDELDGQRGSANIQDDVNDGGDDDEDEDEEDNDEAIDEDDENDIDDDDDNEDYEYDYDEGNTGGESERTETNVRGSRNFRGQFSSRPYPHNLARLQTSIRNEITMVPSNVVPLLRNVLVSDNDPNDFASRTSHGRRTHDRATNTQAGYWSHFENNRNSEPTIPQVTTPSTSTGTRSSITSQGTTNSAQIADIDVRNEAPSSPLEEMIETNRQDQVESTQMILDPATNDLETDVEMITVIYEPSITSNEWPQQGSYNRNQVIAVQDSSNSQSSPSTSSQTQPGGSSSFSMGGNANSGDHTYSAPGANSMEVESLPETQYGALSLVPVRQHQQLRDNSVGLSPTSQIYPENLVTERRAILASEPRIASGSQPLDLETSVTNSQGTSLAAVRQSVSGGVAAGGTNMSGSRDERSLSDIDIQTRFLGFFQSRLDSHRSNSRGFRQRQMARRGGYRGYPVPPFAVHNPTNVPHNPLVTRVVPGQQPQQQPQPPTNEEESHASLAGLQHEDERRSAVTLLNRVTADLRALSGRSQQQHNQNQHSRSKRLGKDMQHHGESLLSLLLRLHAKYSQQASSYQYDEARALANVDLNRSRIGDGAHFVTVVLDLICTLDKEMLVKIEQLKQLIWSHEEYKPTPNERPRVKNNNNDKDLGIKANIGAGNQDSDCSPPLFWSHSPSKVSAGFSLNSSGSGSSVTAPGASTSSLAGLTPAERRKRAKEFQSKLMADFANKQKAFIEKYESLSQQQTAHMKTATTRSDKIGETSGSSTIANTGLDEEPINLSSKLSYKGKPKPEASDYDEQRNQGLSSKHVTDKSFCEGDSINQNSDEVPKGSNLKSEDSLKTTGQSSKELPKANRDGCPPIYECCICGVEGPSDIANPLGQVVLLQSTSIYGHSHMRPQSERQLPCEESECADLREETYAKYLERRIDLLCEHFSESSWLDSINIGAEGGVHVQSCGHYLHIECHQSYIKSLDQEDRLRSRNDSDEFLCPLCRQLANSVLPILSEIRQPGQSSLALVSSPDLEDQIKLVSLLLEGRLPPNQKELRSSSSFCSHLTKATGPQYRLVRTSASMHSLFLFLTSIARTNLETDIIVRSMRQSISSNTSHQQEFYCDQSAGATSSNNAFTGANASKRSCFKLLFYVLALNAQTLINDQWFTGHQIWSYLTHRIDEKNRLSVKPMNSEVPLLLRDPTAMLLQFLFAITNSLCYRANFTCVAQILFNLTVVQSVALVLSYVKPGNLCSAARSSLSTTLEDESPSTERERSEQEATSSSGAYHSSTNDFQDLLASVDLNLGQLLTTTHSLMSSSVRYRHTWQKFVKGGLTRSTSCNSEHTSSAGNSEDSATKLKSPAHCDEAEKIALIENRVKLACLPFLRAAASIQHHLYDLAHPTLCIVNDDLITDCQAIEADFNTLTAYLNLGQNLANSKDSAKFSQTNANRTGGTETMMKLQSSSSSLICALKWPQADKGDAGVDLIASWSAELLRFGAEYSIAARTLLVGRPLAWYRPSLMQLPRSFDDIFMFYYRKQCSLCNQVPKDVAICLVCGAPICFRVSCCKDRTRSRQTHSQHCGANTAVFLAVHTSSIVVIRGNRACVWGSIYLDAHDEEDSGLQRGRPLYLVQARYELLEEQWLTHSFDHTCGRRWIYLHENQ